MNQMPDRLEFEKKLWEQGYRRIMGLDEVGRGCLSGPVVAAGVILSPGASLDEVRDSKATSLEEREYLSKKIKNEALFWNIRCCDPREIDQYNILWASIRAMQKCVADAEPAPDYLLVDGNRFSDSMIPHTCLVGGDDRSTSIGAASIIAKVYRDRLMIRLHEKFPYYGWDTNVGYPTEKHYEGLKNHGYTPHHRQSFNLRTRKAWKQGE